MKNLPALLNTPARAVIAVGLIVLVSEYLIMALFEAIHGHFPAKDGYQLVMVFNYLDPIMLIAITSPALYLLIFRPMRNQQGELEVARRKIEQSYHEWMAALDVVDDPIFLHDKNFRIQRCNKAYQQRAGVPFHEIIGQLYYEVFPKNHAPMACCLRAMEKAEKEEETEEVLAGDAIYRSRSFSVHDDQGVYLYSVHILEDITERKHQEERTAALLKLSTSVETLDEKTLLQQGLDAMQHLTDSRIGFLHFVSEDQNEIELVTWSTDTLAHYCQAAFDRHYPLSAAGIWVNSALLKQPVIINDYATAPGKKGLPEGHADVQRFICVPVLEGTQVRMIVGVGNAARDYDEHDVETLKLFSYDLHHTVQRKRAEVSLQTSEAFKSSMIDNSNDCIKVLSSDGLLKYMSEGGQRLLEIEDITKYLDKSWIEFWNGEDREAAREAVSKAAQGEIGKFQGYSPTEKGTPKWWDIVITPIREANGAVNTLLAVSRDITESKIAEDKLAESERHFRAIAQSANDAIITGAGAGNIVGWNAAAERMFGYTAAETIGQPLTMLIPERFRNLHSTGLARVVAGGTPHVIGKTVELAGLRKDGSEFPLEFSLSQWQSVNGKFFTAIIRDITERKRAEDSLRKLSLTVEQSPNSIIITDLDANIEYVNAAFVKATGYSLAEAIGQNPRILHSGKTPKTSYDDLWAHLARGEAWKGEFINRRKDGSEYIESVLISPVRGDDGRVTNYLAIKEDITERKRMEEKVTEQLDELRGWHDITLGREMRIIELKHEVDELLSQAGQMPRYPSAESDDSQEK